MNVSLSYNLSGLLTYLTQLQKSLEGREGSQNEWRLGPVENCDKHYV